LFRVDLINDIAHVRFPQNSTGLNYQSLIQKSVFSLFCSILFSQELSNQGFVLFAQLKLLQQIWPAQPGSSQRLLSAPAGNGLVISRQQYCGYLHPIYPFRTREVRIIQQAITERILCCGKLITQNTGQQSDHCIYYYCGSQFATTEDVITNRPLLVNFTFYQALIDALVSTTNQYQVATFCQRL